MFKPKIAIIGGGSSGLFLASLLSDAPVDIYLFEKNNKLGKKILASGNGKCNFSNVNNLDDKYNNQFANSVINRFDVNTTLQFFRNMGLIYKNDDQGRCYPVSECASSVLDCLKLNLNNINILLDTEVKNIVPFNNKYRLEYGDASDVFDYIVCCSGSLASNLGSEKAYKYLDALNLKQTPLKASLAPVIVEENISNLKGVRVKCRLDLLDEYNQVCYSENGEILFKEDSLSGIAVFNASSIINRRDCKYKIKLDLSSNIERKELFNYFNSRKENASKMFKGFLNDKIAEYIIEKYNLNKRTLKEKDVLNIIEVICNLTFEVKGIYPIKEGQVCSGGIDLSELNENLELVKYPNVYVAGELIDVDGMSGGYNLQFAWSSAGVIAQSIITKVGCYF